MCAFVTRKSSGVSSCCFALTFACAVGPQAKACMHNPWKQAAPECLHFHWEKGCSVVCSLQNTLTLVAHHSCLGPRPGSGVRLSACKQAYLPTWEYREARCHDRRSKQASLRLKGSIMSNLPVHRSRALQRSASG